MEQLHGAPCSLTDRLIWVMEAGTPYEELTLILQNPLHVHSFLNKNISNFFSYFLEINM